MRRCERLGVCARTRAVTISAKSILRRSHEGHGPRQQSTSDGPHASYNAMLRL